MTRECTNQLLEMIDEGLLDARDVVLCCLKYMSEDDVRVEMIDEGLLDARDVVLCCLKYMTEDDVRDMAHVNEIEWQASGEEEPDDLDPIPDPDYADRAAADYAARVTSGGDR